MVAGLITRAALIYANTPKCKICSLQQTVRNTHDKNRSLHIWINRGLFEMHVLSISPPAEVWQRLS